MKTYLYYKAYKGIKELKKQIGGDGES